jgi:hypothetical protein
MAHLASRCGASSLASVQALHRHCSAPQLVPELFQTPNLSWTLSGLCSAGHLAAALADTVSIMPAAASAKSWGEPSKDQAEALTSLLRSDSCSSLLRKSLREVSDFQSLIIVFLLSLTGL